jgi:hypothetical protein
MAIKMKSVVNYRTTAQWPTHARTEMPVPDLNVIIDVPFPESTLTVNCDTPATQDDLTRVGVETPRHCAIAKLFEAAGTDLTVNWGKAN